MGDNTINSSSCSSPPSYSHHHAHISSFLFAQQSRENKMPFSSSYYPSPAPLGHGVRRSNPPPPPELDFDSPDCESEEGGVEAPEEEAAAKSAAAPVPGRSGSKRSRAAEVHNLSEKRRRSRINEKMKALQNLIPNSNKTDKASMLDEAIEYLKQLQLQVQMLSMRNGLNIHPIYLPEALQPLQVSQLSGGFGVDNGSAMTDMGAVGMLPLNQDSSACNNTFDLPSHESIILPAVTSVGASETTFGMEPSHSRSFQLPVIAEEIFREDMVAQQQLDSGQTARNLSGNEIKTMAMATPLHFSAQASSIEHDGHLEACILRVERSGDVVHKDRHDNHHQIFAQQLDSLQRGRSFMNGDLKTEESSDF